MIFLAVFPILAFATVIFTAFSSATEDSLRWNSNVTYACCDERAAKSGDLQLVA